MLTVSSKFLSTTIPIAELTTSERNALAGIIGLSSARRRAFQALREKPLFRKIKPQDVWNTCPKRARDFDVTVEIILNSETAAGSNATQVFQALLPNAEVSPAIHKVSGMCPRCGLVHSISRQSVLVKTVVAGVQFSNLYSA